MSNLGSFSVRAGVLQRVPHLMDLLVRNRPGTTGYRLWGARTLMDAYGDPADSGVNGSGGTLLLEAITGRTARSESIIRLGATVEESRKGHTSFQFDVEDFVVPANPPPIGSDNEYLYVRVQEKRVTSGWVAVPQAAANNPDMPIRGPILVVPSTTFYGTSAGVFSLQGNAPTNTGCVAGVSPILDQTCQVPPPLYITFPRAASNVRVRNNGQSTILLSYGLDMPMIELVAGAEWSPIGGGYSQPHARDVVIAAKAGVQNVVPFVLDVVANLGEG